jgi:hypothetical protein
MVDWRQKDWGQRMLAWLGLSKNAKREDLIALIEGRAAAFDLPLFAQTAPAGWLSYEQRLILTEDQTESERAIVRFNEPCMLIGVMFVITATSFADRENDIPTLDELDVKIDFDRQKEYATARIDAASTIGPSGYAPCSSQDIRLPRLLMRMCPDPNGETGFTFKSRYADSSSSGLEDDVLISTICFVKPLED